MIIKSGSWIEIHDFPPELFREAMCEWLRWHGVDPGHVAVPGRIERDEDARQVRYLTWCCLTSPGHRHLGAEVHHVERVVQLEAVPSPFPSGRDLERRIHEALRRQT